MKAPVLTIFIGGNHEASNHLWELYVCCIHVLLICVYCPIRVWDDVFPHISTCMDLIGMLLYRFIVNLIEG